MDFSHIQTNYSYLLKTKGGTFRTVADWDSKNRVMTQFSNTWPDFWFYIKSWFILIPQDENSNHEKRLSKVKPHNYASKWPGHNNLSQSLLSALVMENVDRSNGLERFLEICVKSQVN